MKKLLLICLMMLVCGTCFADVTAEILDVIQDSENGSIVVKTQYKIDGVEVVSRYPQLDGKYYWVTRYNILNFAGMTDLQAKNYILNDLKRFGENLIQKKYFEIANFQYTEAKAAALIGTTGTITTASVLVDTNADGIADTKWILKSDGTRTEEPYVA